MSSLSEEHHAPVRTFLIADIRGYTRFTEEYGDEASARLTAKFSDIVREGVQVRRGTLIEIRGDEALAVFDSARQAIRSAVDLQNQFAEETDPDSDLPLRVGIGIDSGEAIKLEDGSFRGAALNIAARLCALTAARSSSVTGPATWLGVCQASGTSTGDERTSRGSPTPCASPAWRRRKSRARSGSSWSSGGREASAGLFFSEWC